MSLRPYQQIASDFILERDRCALWADMGLGKTLATLHALRTAQMAESGPALILAPKRVAQTTWPDEARKWGYDDVQPVLGTPKEREAALKRDRAMYSINYDNLPWLAEHLGDKWPFTTVVSDESTRLKGFRGGFRRHPKSGKVYYQRGGGKRTAALGFYAHRQVKRFIELTGTPAPNGLEDLWGQMWFIDQGERLGRTHESFITRWFRPSYNGFGVEPLPFAQAEIQNALLDVCLTLRAEDWFELDKPIVTDIRVQLPAKARATYRALEKDLFAKLDSGEVEITNAAHLSQACLQAGGGALYIGEGAKDWEELHDAKLDALASILEEANGAPVLVAYQWRHELARIQAAFPFARTLDSSPRTVQDWNEGRVRLLAVHPASAGHGLSLQDGGNRLVYFSHWWNLEERLQVLERIGPVRQAQSGHKRPVFVYNIIADDTLDDVVIARNAGKGTVQDALREAARRRK